MIFSTEAGLIKKAKAGNKEAWLKLIQRHEKQVYHHCLRLVGNPDDACDLMQDVFISVFKALESFSGDSQFSTWLYKITYARCMDFFRKKNTKSEELIEVDTDELESTLIQDCTNQEVIQALKCLPFEQRQIIELKFFAQLTFDEISEITTLSTNTVKTRLYSALKKMKGHLEVVNG
ncbi:RNA polymerase sigma factor, sigma-70 family [Pseudoalteromonas luteoviolacea B = ATCC 29581]|nr:RNA polymerase sigma factor, sigma-70 family [Pseudoalteromonas luteoviolacea B = ATCC 29581]